MKLFTLFLALTSCFIVSAQNLAISDEVKNIGAIREIQILNENEYVATSIKQRFGRNKIVLEHFVNQTKVKEIETPYRVNKSLGKFEDFILVDGKGLAFISDQVGKSRNLYTETLDLEDGEFGKADFLIEDPVPRNRQLPSAFKIKVSKNQKYVGVMVDVSLKGDSITTYKYVVIDGKKEIINQGKFNLSANTQNIVDFQFWVTNSGKIAAYHKEIVKQEEGLFKTKLILVSSHLYYGTDSEIHHALLNNDASDVVTELELVENDKSTLFVHGFYRKMSHDQIDNKIHGVFFKSFDYTLTLNNESYKEFNTRILLMGLTEEEVRKQREEMSLNDYVIRNTFIDTTQQALYGLAEQFYRIEESYPDARGYLKTVTSYYYNDILAYRINFNGKIEWIEKAPKFQVSNTDKGYYLGYFSYLNADGNLVVIYNDNTANYLKDGGYIDPEKRTNTGTRPSSYTTTQLTINGKDGEKQFQEFINRFQRKTVLVPRLGFSDAQGKIHLMLIESKSEYKFVQILN